MKLATVKSVIKVTHDCDLLNNNVLIHKAVYNLSSYYN